MKIYNLGSLNIDYVYSVDHIVQPGETQTTGGMNVFLGGKGINQSMALAKAGVIDADFSPYEYITDTELSAINNRFSGCEEKLSSARIMRYMATVVKWLTHLAVNQTLRGFDSHLSPH